MDADTVLLMWFGPLDAQGMVDTQRIQQWFTKDPTFDTHLRDHFAQSVEDASSGKLNHWLIDPRGRLALVILLDQCQRNLFRNSPKAFRSDALTRDWVLEAVSTTQDRALAPIERALFYLPLEHSERLEDQHQSLRCYEQLMADAPNEHQATFAMFYDYAKRHAVIIERFGRFPHRNVTLGRTSTPEETAFLREPDSSF